MHISNEQGNPTPESLVSVCPSGEVFQLPQEKDYEEEFKRLQQIVKEQRSMDREIVVVMGVGFVGAVMAGVVADSVDAESGNPNKFVIGMQRPSTRSYWKIPYINRGIAPVEAEDPEVAPLIERCVKEKKTLIATYTYEALSLADVVIVDVQCDYFKETFGDVRQGHADIAALEASLKTIGEKIKPECLVLIETTVPPGTTEYVAYPIMKKAFGKRGLADSEPLLAHSFERVMPGRNYVASVRDFWRVCSGINVAARERVREFLSDILNVEQYPLTVLDRPIESETCKIIENSYRAATLAFLDEWSVFAERNGVDLINGGYCLPKDGGLGVWAYHTLMGFEDDVFKITPAAIDINDTRALRVPQQVRDALRNMGKIVAASKIVLLGASYREDVGDTLPM
jgi:UDP-N-acetyl-D-mannosaminuronate dehydrogenase